MNRKQVRTIVLHHYLLTVRSPLHESFCGSPIIYCVKIDGKAARTLLVKEISGPANSTT